MGMARALVRNGAQRAAIGLIVDPEVARQAHEAGVGATIRAALGAKSGIPGDVPLEASSSSSSSRTGASWRPAPSSGDRG